jgi:hypothetical protein
MSELSYEEINTLRAEIEDDPKNHEKSGNFYLFTPAARKKLTALAWAVTYKLAERK